MQIELNYDMTIILVSDIILTATVMNPKNQNTQPCLKTIHSNNLFKTFIKRPNPDT